MSELVVKTEKLEMSHSGELTEAEEKEAAALIAAGVRENTTKSMDSALRHFRDDFGGFLPATPQTIKRYILAYKDTLAPGTIRSRLSMIAGWHSDRSFPDPTKSVDIKAMMKGLRTAYQKKPKKARPLGFDEIKIIITGLEAAHSEAQLLSDIRQKRKQELMCLRDKAFFLIGFWCAWRSDELIRLRVENVTLFVENGQRVLQLYLPYSKGDREAEGREWKLVELPAQCPVNAYLDWINAAQIENGPVFCAINRWSQVSDTPIHNKSVIKMMREAMVRAGIDSESALSYSSHSLRRGFANFATTQDISAKDLMTWVGWGSIATAIAYLESNQSLHKTLLSKVLMKGID